MDPWIIRLNSKHQLLLLNTQYSPLKTQNSILTTQYSILNTQYWIKNMIQWLRLTYAWCIRKILMHISQCQLEGFGGEGRFNNYNFFIFSILTSIIILILRLS